MMRAQSSELRVSSSGAGGRVAWLAVALTAALCDAAAGQIATSDGVSRLKLRSSATLTASAVLMRDVLSFDDADPALLEAVGGRPVFEAAEKAAVPRRVPEVSFEAPHVVTHDHVVRRLEVLGVNMARVLVCGAAECEISMISRGNTDDPQAVSQSRADAVKFELSPEHELDAAPLLRTAAVNDGPQSLADVLRTCVQRELRDNGRAEVEFERAGADFLALTSPPWDFSVRTSDNGELGLREFSVALRRDGRTQRTVKIGANVKAMRRVLVARKPLSVGACIREGDLAAEERLFESGAEVGFGEPGALVGQQVQRFVPAGEMLRRADVKAVDLVQRSRPVTVIGSGSGVSLSLTGVAIDAGGYGETVRVRLGELRKEQREVRGVVTGIATVRIEEGV